MTDCKELQRQFSASAAGLDPEFSKHAEHCAECADFARKILGLHRRLRSAMQVEVPFALQQKLKAIPRTERRRWLRRLAASGFAIAASIVIGIGLLNFGLLNQARENGLSRVVYEHIMHEPQALTAVFPVKQAVLTTTLKDFGVEFSDSAIVEVMHVTICPIGDTHGLHLVLQGKQGPVTLLFMPTKSVAARIPFERGRFSGFIEPIEVGLVAVVGEKGEALDRFDRMIKESLRWL